MSTITLTDTDRVRNGANVYVRVQGRDQATVARAVTEARKHVRVTSVFGLFEAPSAISYGERRSDGTFKGWIVGQTWRDAGQEYTVRELKYAMASAIPAGAATVAIVVFEWPGESDSVSAITATDPRASGSAAAQVAEAGGKVRDAVTGTLGAVVDTAGAASDAARGIADLASGAGEGARGFGAFVGGSPAVSFALLVGVLGLILYAKVK